jgi:hypothetical protein
MLREDRHQVYFITWHRNQVGEALPEPWFSDAAATCSAPSLESDKSCFAVIRRSASPNALQTEAEEIAKERFAGNYDTVRTKFSPGLSVQMMLSHCT